MSTGQRKLDHLKICLEEDVESSVSTGFDDIRLVHRVLPEMDMGDIELKVDFLGRRLSYPIVIAGMTGGHEKAYRVNENLALAAEELRIAIGVGSQRAAIEDRETEHTYRVVRENAPHAFRIANLGAVQFCSGEYSLAEAERAVEMVEAHALALHLNPLQEAVQKEGDLNFSCVDALEELSEELSVPVIAKETGAGIAGEEARLLEKAGAAAIDVGGLGGTSFAIVESYRGYGIGSSFIDWGVPTAPSVAECASSTSLPVVATGGLRSGIDAAKAVALGGSLTGFALPLLKPAMRNPEDVVERLEQIIAELRIAMFLTSSKSVEELRKASHVLTGATREWMESRGIQYEGAERD